MSCDGGGRRRERRLSHPRVRERRRLAVAATLPKNPHGSCVPKAKPMTSKHTWLRILLTRWKSKPRRFVAGPSRSRIRLRNGFVGRACSTKSRRFLAGRSRAERERFELSVELYTLRRFSKPLVSATHPPLRKVIVTYDSTLRRFSP